MVHGRLALEVLEELEQHLVLILKRLEALIIGLDLEVMYQMFLSYFTFTQETGGGGNDDVFSMYTDGIPANDPTLEDEGDDSEGLTLNSIMVNTRRAQDRFLGVNFAELIIYNRTLTACEQEEITLYLGNKYGRDFANIVPQYDTVTFSDATNDISGIGKNTTACTTGPTIDEGVSDIMIINTASSNDTTGEYITFCT